MANVALSAAFWSRVNTQGPVPSHVPHLGACWVWLGAPNNYGYGRVTVGGRRELAHRVSFMMANGHWPMPCALHRCDNRLCVRPDHLREGTRAENQRDMAEKGRAVTPGLSGERHGMAKLTGEQVREIRADGRSRKLREQAARYGVSESTISLILLGKTWCDA